MKNTSMKRRFAAPVLTISAIVVAAISSTAAFAAPFACSTETFVNRRGTTLNYVDTATGVVSNGPTLTIPSGNDASGRPWGTDMNAIGQHPITREVFAIDVFGSTATTGRARRIENTGQLVDVGAAIPMTGLNVSNHAGGTFDSVGNWLLANNDGKTTVVDLVPGSPTYGTTIATGSIAAPYGRYMSGDIAYRASDDRVYFLSYPITTPAVLPVQVFSVSRAAFVAGGALPTPVAGPTIPSIGSVVGSSVGFDSQGNLWYSTTALAPANARPIYKFAAADLTATGPIAPVGSYGDLPTGSGSDGFMCTPSKPVSAQPVPALDGRSSALLTLLLAMMGAVALRKIIKR